VTTPSGLQVLDVREGTGPAPEQGQTAVVDWAGYTVGYYGRWALPPRPFRLPLWRLAFRDPSGARQCRTRLAACLACLCPQPAAPLHWRPGGRSVRTIPAASRREPPLERVELTLGPPLPRPNPHPPPNPLPSPFEARNKPKGSSFTGENKARCPRGRRGAGGGRRACP
jgi:hypothetical protein